MATEFERAAAATTVDDGGAGDDAVELEDIVFKKQVFDLKFHPNRRVVAASTVTGRVHLYEHGTRDGAEHSKLYEATHHAKAARCVEFSADGGVLYSGGSDCRVRVLDVGTLQLADERKESHTAEPVNVMALYGASVLATGDDEGGVTLWDVRAPPAAGVAAKFSEHGDFVADLWAQADQHHLLCAGGDGALSVYDVRGKGALVDISETLDDELLSMAVLKEGRKVVCGSQDGVLQIFTYGNWDDIDDRFPGHPQSVDAMIKIDEDTVATGSSDGLIRLVSIHPNKLIGVIGEHEEFPIETLRKNFDNTLMASCSHDKRIKFWDIRYLYEEDDDEDEDGGGGGGGGGDGANGDASGDGEDDEEMGGGAGPAPASRQARLQSAKESFFGGM